VPVHFWRVPDDNDIPIEPGAYRRVHEYWADHGAKKGVPNTYWAEICCPGCHRVSMVGRNHTTADAGVVQPSYVCPFPPCTFHQMIVLDDWDRPSTPRRR